ncbi:hypothetical protein Tco_1164978 [Tanacetum coccineum]
MLVDNPDELVEITCQRCPTFHDHIIDETVIKEWEDRMERAATTTSSLEAEQDSVLVYAARHSLTTVRHKLMLPGITSYCWFWTTAKAKTVNEERQIQALVDKKKVIITEKSLRSDLMLEDAKGTECLPNDVIFEQLTLMGYENLTQKLTSWNEFSSTMASAIIYLATNQKFNFSKYIFDHMMKNLEGGVKFLMYPRFVQVFLDKQVEGMSKHKGIYVTPSHTKKIFANMKREGKEPIPDEATNEEPIFTPSCDPPQNGEDRLQHTELMSLCTKLQKQFLDLEEAKTAQAKKITSLKNLGAQEDASKQGRKIANLDADAEVTLINETQERYDEEMLFDVQDDLLGEEVVAKKEVAKKEVSTADPVTTTGEVVTTASATTTQASAFTPIVSSSQLPKVKDKGKAKMVEPEKPLKKKDQIALDEELALRLHAEE